jgi:broad specificity phosphatase PhoE
MRRARETTIPIAEEFGLQSSVDHRLRERINWDGPDAESLEDFLDDWRAPSADRSHRPRSGDSSSDAAARFLTALNELAATHSDSTAMVITHGGVTTDALRTLLGDDALQTRAPRLIDDGVPCCAITTLSATDDGWAVTAIADTQHLDDTFRDPPP